MSNIVDDVKREFAKSENALIKIILINTAVFLVLLLLKIILTLSQSSNVYLAVLILYSFPLLPTNFYTSPGLL
jgi:Na+/proline symporter